MKNTLFVFALAFSGAAFATGSKAPLNEPAFCSGLFAPGTMDFVTGSARGTSMANSNTLLNEARQEFAYRLGEARNVCERTGGDFYACKTQKRVSRQGPIQVGRTKAEVYARVRCQ